MMTFEQFQSTRKWADDVHAAIGEDRDEPESGFVYEGGLHIFAMGGGAAPESYLLVIANSQRASGSLTVLERDLYEYGCAEGILGKEV